MYEAFIVTIMSIHVYSILSQGETSTCNNG